MLDGVQPTRDTFHSLIAGSMKGSRLQDAFFFRNEMKGMGILPDVCKIMCFYLPSLYGCIFCCTRSRYDYITSFPSDDCS